jgi:hypothetical protein
MTVDVLRSCYDVGMRFSDSGPVVRVRWFFSAPNAAILRGLNSFRSLNWEDAAQRQQLLGEQPGNRRWNNGQRPLLLAGDHECGEGSNWQNGFPGPFTPGRAITTNGVPFCCLPPTWPGKGSRAWTVGDSSIWLGAGAALWSGTASWTTAPVWFSKGGWKFLGSSTWAPSSFPWTGSGSFLWGGTSSWSRSPP